MPRSKDANLVSVEATTRATDGWQRLYIPILRGETAKDVAPCYLWLGMVQEQATTKANAGVLRCAQNDKR